MKDIKFRGLGVREEIAAESFAGRDIDNIVSGTSLSPFLSHTHSDSALLIGIASIHPSVARLSLYPIINVNCE